MSAIPTRRRLHRLVDQMAERPVVLVADLVVDHFVIGRPVRVSREAPTLILEKEEERIVPGGGGNAAANVRSLGGRPLVAGSIGDDASGEQLLSRLSELGIDSSLIVRRCASETPTKTRILGGGPTTFKQQIVRIDTGPSSPLDENESRQLFANIEHALARSNQSAKPVVILSDYGYGVVEPLFGRLREILGGNATILIDSRSRVSRFEGLDGATPNQEEAEALAECALDTDEQLVEAGPLLVDRLGCRFLLITRGSRGMALFQEDQPALFIPIHGTEQVADVTGAGDTVIGTLGLAMAAGATVVEAALLANYAGGVVVLKAGTATLSERELHGAIGSDPSVLETLRWVAC